MNLLLAQREHKITVGDCLFSDKKLGTAGFGLHGFSRLVQSCTPISSRSVVAQMERVPY